MSSLPKYHFYWLLSFINEPASEAGGPGFGIQDDKMG